MSTPDEVGREFAQALGSELYSPPMLGMRVLVPRPLGDDWEACSVAMSALVADLREAVSARGLRGSGGITVAMWAVAVAVAGVADHAVQGVRGGWVLAQARPSSEDWVRIERQEPVGGALPEWAHARMYEALVHVE